MINTEALTDLLGRAASVEERVRRVVDERRSSDPNPDDPFRGLYVSDELAERLLAGDRAIHPAGDADDHGRSGASRLQRLAELAGLDTVDVELLIIALLPDLDARFEKLYGYLNDDVSRRRATAGLALELAGRSAWAAGERARLGPARPLVAENLIMIEDADRPFLTRTLRVPDRVIGHLLGDDRPDPSLVTMVDQVPPYRVPLAVRLGRALQAGVGLVHIREHAPGTAASLAVAALSEVGRGALVLDLSGTAGDGHRDDAAGLMEIAIREALLTDSGLVIGPVEMLAESAPTALYRSATARIPVIMTGRRRWEPQWTLRPPLLLEAPQLGGRERRELWRITLDPRFDGDGSELIGSDRPDPDLLHLVAHLALGPGQVQRAVRAAEVSAVFTGAPISADDLRRGVRAQNAAGLERLARRIEPEVGWRDLVLAPAAERALHELTARARYRDTVLTDWRMRRGGGRGHGVVALFAGDSGTGKTMAAEVIAGDLGLDLYTVNLATVVDKYIGETEKNLERIFVEAAGVSAVLFFDEADAIFGKRSEVKDAHDRYANIESAYLLQRLELFDGLAVLASNLRANIDDAFTRRLDMIIDFPSPSVDLRRKLWQRCLGPPLPIADDLDLDFLAAAFEMAGGNIRSAATTAAYLAAAAETPVTMDQVITAVEREYRKLGRLVLEREFGRYLPMLKSPVVDGVAHHA